MASNSVGTSNKAAEAAPDECPITRTVCDVMGMANPDPAVVSCAEQIGRDYVKQIIRFAAKLSTKSARRKMAIIDVESSVRTFRNRGTLEVSAVDTLNYGVDQLAPVPGTSGLFSYPQIDVEVDKDDTETYSLLPRDIRMISYALVQDGQPVVSDYTVNVDEEDTNFFEKSIPEGMVLPKRTEESSGERSCTRMFREHTKMMKLEQKVELKPVYVETLTVEQQIFMKEIITICMGQDDKRRHEALHTLETDAGLQPILPHLTHRVCKSIAANISQRCLSLIIYAGRIIRAISNNKACDMTITLHDVIPALLSCCVGRNICSKPVTDNHWALRDFSARTLIAIVREQIGPEDRGATSRRLYNFCINRVFKNPTSSFPMIQGTIYILQEFVNPDHVPTLIHEINDMIIRCKVHMESRPAESLSVVEAGKLLNGLMKCEAVLRQRERNRRV